MSKFSKDTRLWLKTVIAQRRLMLKTGKSLKDKAKVEQSLNELYKHLMAYAYENEEHMARFVIRHHDNILNILPGHGSTNYTKRLGEFINLQRKANQILNPIIMAYELF